MKIKVVERIFDMDNMQSNPTYESNSSAGVGGSESAFEMFASGASIDEVNARFFSEIPADAGSKENAEADANSQIADASDAEPVATADAEDENSGLSGSQPADGSSESINTDVSAEGKKATADEMRKFTQAEVDAFARRVRVNEKGARDRLQSEYDGFVSDVADYFGVDTASVRDTLKRESIRRAAEREGIEDLDLFERAKRAEDELGNLKRMQEDAEKKAFVDGFLNDVGSQLEVFALSNPAVDINAYSQNADFNYLLKSLYTNEATRANCVQMAFGAMGIGGNGAGYNNISEGTPHPLQAVPLPHNGKASGETGQAGEQSHQLSADGGNDNAVKAQQMVESNRKRASESASGAAPVGKGQQLDYSKMKPSDFLALGQRAAKGDVIMP